MACQARRLWSKLLRQAKDVIRLALKEIGGFEG